MHPSVAVNFLLKVPGMLHITKHEKSHSNTQEQHYDGSCKFPTEKNAGAKKFNSACKKFPDKKKCY